jgi:hypothetical protein
MGRGYRLRAGWDDDWARTCGGCWLDGHAVALGHLGMTAVECWA